MVDFPNSPNVGDRFANGLISWTWDGISWNLVGTEGPTGVKGDSGIHVGNTPPVDTTLLWVDTTLTGPQGDWLTPQPINGQSGSYTLVSSDVGKLVTLVNASAAIITVPGALGLSAGQRIDFVALGGGTVTFFAGAGATVNATPSLKLRAQYSMATLLCVSTDVYVLAGDLSA